jgi:uncharacterized protein YecT (DUF1311 family)
MTRIALAAVLTALSLPAAHADECLDKAVSQAEMSDCARKAHIASDAELNTLYRQIERRLNDDADARRRLVSAQRAWVAFRDAECAFASSSGGSASPMVHSMCLDDLTRKRVADFKSYLSCGDKGDVSCPVPPGS